MNKKICIVDYGMGNIRSVFNAFKYLGFTSIVSSHARDIANSDCIILPGVGSFRVAMDYLVQHGIDDAIKTAVIDRQKQILGICLGFQLLANSSREDGETTGLQIMDGLITKIDSNEISELKLPHVGFNTVQANDNSLLYKDLGSESDFYFVHSFCLENHCLDQSQIANCAYGGLFVASYENQNVFGTQFHPEKSQANGLKLLENFLLAS